MCRSTWFAVMAVAFTAVGLMSCGDLGQVEQGLVIDFDAAGGHVTVITDSNPSDPKNPRYDVLPPKIVRLPEDSDQMGPTPAAGMLIHFDAESGELVVFDPASSSLRSIEFSVLQRADGVYADDSRVAGVGLPRVDEERSAVTLYAPRVRQLVTITVPEEALSLPRECWQSGDEVRYYYKDPAEALRMMNVTKTSVSS